MWKSTSSNGGEYLIVWKDWVQVLCMPLYTIYFVIIFNNTLDYNE